MKDVYELATTVFCKEEWKVIGDCLATCLGQTTVWRDEAGAPLAFVIVNDKPPPEYCIDTADGSVFISYCGVSATAQGKGYGSRILKETLQCLFHDFHTIELVVDETNVAAQRLYERLGFKKVCKMAVIGVPVFLMQCAEPA